MDQCQHCLEYHIPGRICDAYIKWLEKQPDKKEDDETENNTDVNPTGEE